MKKLIIVESPSKAKTISSFLNGYNVIASKGHIVDLPKFKLGVKITETECVPTYEITSDHKTIASEIKKLAQGAKVYLATDEDREGEAIAWHIANMLGGKTEEYDRIVFHEITKSAINKALENPRKIELNSVNAQQARRILDRVIGFKLSGLIRNKIPGDLSAGRVQSAALKLIIEKELSIRNFKSIKYYMFNTIFKPNIDAKLYSHLGKKITKQSILDIEEANKILNSIKNDKYKVGEITTQTKHEKPKAPFMTSSLQQTASSTLNYSPKKTMDIAQKLYEGVDTPDGTKGVITYMRTDSLNLSVEAIEAARGYIYKTYGDKFLPSEPRTYVTNKKGAQEAHEAIRVTDVNFTPEIAQKYLEPDQLKLYTMIYNRFMACQMTDAIIDNKTLYINGAENIFKVTGRSIIEPGWSILDDSREDVILPKLEQDTVIELQEAKVEEKETEPPARYNEASLIKELEDKGIGRPSTYASTTSLLLNRGYVVKDGKALVPSEKGFNIVEFLDKYFSNITDIEFTAHMEEKLDLIASGEVDYKKAIIDFCLPLMDAVADGYKNIPSQKQPPKISGKLCPKCSKDLYERINKTGNIYYACSGFPKCKYIDWGDSSTHKPTELEDECPNCKVKLILKKGKFAMFGGCPNYPKCKYTLNIKKSKNEKESTNE